MAETLTQQDFDARHESGRLMLALVGMSGMGKSHWSNILAREADFAHVCCDALIERDLDPELKGQGYAGGIQDVAAWMGQPYEERSPENQQKYLDLETKHIEAINTKLVTNGFSGNTVIDTTGSVVHIPRQVYQTLASRSLVVCLEATYSQRMELFAQYLADPKPVVWGDAYAPQPGEDTQTALERCYPKLLEERAAKYRLMADVTIPGLYAREQFKTAEDFLLAIRQRLPDESRRSASPNRVRSIFARDRRHT